MIKGIYQKLEEQSSSLNEKIITPQGLAISELIEGNGVLIGKSLAQQLNIRLGDSIELFFPAESQRSRSAIKLDKTHVRVNGIFKTGIEDFDESVIVASHELLASLFEVHPTTIGLKTDPAINESDLIKKLSDRFSLYVYSWQDLYPALVSALKLEKYASLLILALIILIASMTIIAVLFMQITHKRKDIAILQAMGAEHSLIRLIFLIMGIFIAGIGSITGISLGIAVSLILKRYPLISLPEAYYTDHLPITLTLEMVCFVFLLVMLISLFATLFATRSLKKINCIDVLKFEA
jgi:lipoprotein-releasing system permease protein